LTSSASGGYHGVTLATWKEINEGCGALGLRVAAGLCGIGVVWLLFSKFSDQTFDGGEDWWLFPVLALTTGYALLGPKLKTRSPDDDDDGR
jgi:hypothetical protein